MINCMIIEDEPLAVDVLVDYISQVPGLHLQASCPDAMQGMQVLRTLPVELMFLDIHLPGLKGLDFLDTLSKPPRVIITTAYHEYALKSYEHNVVDYLLKPIEFKRFLQAVQKVSEFRTAGKEVLPVHCEKRTVLIPMEDIVFIESQKEYVRIQTTTAVHTSRYAISRLEDELDPRKFLRVHRSFLVALGKVSAFNNQEVFLGEKAIPIGGNYREQVGRALSTLTRN